MGSGTLSAESTPASGEAMPEDDCIILCTVISSTHTPIRSGVRELQILHLTVVDGLCTHTLLYHNFSSNHPFMLSVQKNGNNLLWYFFFFCRIFFFLNLAEQHLYVHCTAGTLTCYLCACLLYLLLLWFSGTARSWKSENWPWQIYVAENARWLRPYVHEWCNALLLKMRCVGRQGQNPLNSLMATFSEHWKMGCYPRKQKSTAKCFFERKKNTMGKLPAYFQRYCWI